MMRYHIAFAMLAAAVIIVSGCVSDGTDSSLLSETGATAREVVNQGTGSTLPASVAADVYLNEVSTDRELYHSAEVMNVTAVVYSDGNAENVVVTATGINGRMNIVKEINLTEGENNVGFTYTLPRCNVCGGISPGTYEIGCTVEYGNGTTDGSVSVEIVQ
jgi:hypothetical protein